MTQGKIPCVISHFITMTPEMNENIIKFKALIKEITDNPETEKVLEIEDEFSVPYLPACNICNDHVKTSPEYKELMSRLVVFLDEKMITSNGQHSSMFYEVRKHGFMTRTGESDSFGPLSSILFVRDAANHKYIWQVSYG